MCSVQMMHVQGLWGCVCPHWTWACFVCIQKCVSVCVCVFGLCLSSCHLRKEVALYSAIRAVSLQAGLAIWTHDKEPGPDISHFFSPVPRGVIRFCVSAVYQSTMMHCILTTSLFLSLFPVRLCHPLFPNLSLLPLLSILSLFCLLQFAVSWSTRGAMNWSRSAARGQIKGLTQT